MFQFGNVSPSGIYAWSLSPDHARSSGKQVRKNTGVNFEQLDAASDSHLLAFFVTFVSFAVQNTLCASAPLRETIGITTTSDSEQ